MSYRIAVSGKGGSGKTTVAALLIKALVQEAPSPLAGPILAVDADPNATLAMALGIQPKMTISDLREDIMERRVDVPAGVPKDRVFEYKFHELVLERPKFDFLAMGRPEGPKCYCYVNHLLRGYLQELSADYACVVIDNEAGMEHLSRRTTDNVDLLVLVSQPTVVGLESVRRISVLADKLPISVRRRILVIDTAREDELSPPVSAKAAELGLDTFFIPRDPQVESAWEHGRPLLALPASSPACRAASQLLHAVLSKVTLTGTLKR